MSKHSLTNNQTSPSDKINILFKYWWRAKDIQDYCEVSPANSYTIRNKLKKANADCFNKYNCDLIKRDAVLEAYLNSTYEKELNDLMNQVEVLKKLSTGVGPDA